MGEYELLGELGRGGLSTVHLARPVGTRRRVALKRVVLPRPDAAVAAAFLADAAAATPLHPAVLRPLTGFVHDGEPWLVLRVMAGGSLRRHAGELSPAQMARILVPVLDALDVAARRGTPHGDLKPENVLLGPRGAVMVADFGVVAAHERARGCEARGTWIGTPAYAAPERRVAAHATPAADLFAVGAMAQELLTGRPPPTGGGEEGSPARTRPDLDPRLAAWVDGLTARAPEDRPPGAAAARARLEEIVAEGHGARWRQETSLPAAPPAAAGRDAGPPPLRTRLLAELPRPAAAAAPAAPAIPAGPGRRHPAAAWIAVGLVVVAGAVAGAVARQR